MIDDNLTTLKVNEVMLRKRLAIIDGDRLDQFSTPDDFFEKIAHQDINHYSILIVDYDLRDTKINGYGLIAEMQKNGFIGKAVLLTGDDSTSMGIRMKLTRDVEYVVKNVPMGSNDTISVLSELIFKVRESV